MRLYIPLTKTEFERLRDLAWAERRSPRDHAALLIARSLGLEQVGAPATDYAVPPPPTAAMQAGQREVAHAQ